MNEEQKKISNLVTQIFSFFLIFLLVLAFLFRHYNSTLTMATVMINADTNVEFLLNEKSKVQKVVTFDNDSNDAVKKLKIKAHGVQEGLPLLVQNMYNKGYTEESGNIILVTIASDDEARLIAIKRVLSTTYDISNVAVPVTLIFQTYDNSILPEDGTAVDSKSLFAANLSDKLSLTSDISSLSIEELAIIAKYHESELDNVAFAGEEPTSDFIDAEKAISAALDDAVIEKNDVLYQSFDFTYVDDTFVYSVDIIAGETEYFYEIDANNGSIITSETAQADTVKLEPVPVSEPEYLSEEEVYSIIKVFGNMTDVSFHDRVLELIEDPETPYYDIFCKHNTYTVRCKIDAISGDILYFDESLF